jgi:hypothetical protein
MNDENGEEIFNIFRNLFRDISNITMYDTYDEFLENNININNTNNRRNRYSNNNNNHSTSYDICNNMVFTVINEYNVNMLEYNVNMREYLINNSNTTNHNINTNNTNNANNNNTNTSNNNDNMNTNFIEYNNNISDYNSNIRRFLDLMSTINYNISTNNSRNYRNNENIRQEPRQTYRTNTTNPNRSTNRNNSTNPFGRNRVYTYTPTQLLSYYLPNRQRTFTNVVVRPTERQIIDATQLLNYTDSETYNNTTCPITMEEFNNGEQICQIKHCGHNFREEALRNWFTTNVRCPVCRYDIRDYVNGHADVSNNNVVNDLSGNVENRAAANNVGMDYSMNNIPLNNNSNSTQSVTNNLSNNLSNIIQTYLNQNLNPFVEELNSNLSEFDIVFPIIYYNDASGYYYDSSGLAMHR